MTDHTLNMIGPGSGLNRRLPGDVIRCKYLGSGNFLLLQLVFNFK